MTQRTDNDICGAGEAAANTVDFTADIEFLHGRGLLAPLLLDHATNQPIVWATDAYADLGAGFQPRDSITTARIRHLTDFQLRPRAAKTAATRDRRTKSHAEVFTPLAVCRRMIDAVPFPGDPSAFLRATCLEIACGEAPFLVQRYDPGTGRILPLAERDGILDHKLRICAESNKGKEDFLKLALVAVRSVYGCELQGDSLLIARINVLLSVLEAYRDRFGERPDHSALLRPFALAIAWNLFQVDMLTGTVPTFPPPAVPDTAELFPPGADEKAETPLPSPLPMPRIKKWRNKKAVDLFAEDAPAPSGGESATASFQMAFPAFAATQDRPKKKEPPMKFDYVIGNPPYQDEAIGENKTFAPPIYHRFLDAAFEAGRTDVLVHPARFLFDAGSTPHEWNRKMLADPHFKILHYEPDASKFFPNTDIKGGVAISLHDEEKVFGPIEIFTPYSELNGILHKVKNNNFRSLAPIVVTSYAYHFTEKMHEDHPEAAGQLSAGHAYDFKTNVFERLPQVFHAQRPSDALAYVRIYGRIGTNRVYRFIRRDYVNHVSNLDKWKVLIASVNGAGAFEVFATPIIGQPEVGYTETFMSIGSFDTEAEAQACLKFICTRFARTMLGILKATQHNPPPKWKYVPMQDFTPGSDIDWSQPVAGVDRQLYGKYGLTAEEIGFVETHVREMA